MFHSLGGLSVLDKMTHILSTLLHLRQFLQNAHVVPTNPRLIIGGMPHKQQ